jgi:hypothetical protein
MSAAEAFDQHPPPLARHGGAADDPVHRDEDILPRNRAVHERRAGIVAATDFDPGMVGRQQGAGDPVVDRFRVPQQPVGIAQLERQTDDGGHRRQRDPALAEGEPEPDDFLALELPAADDPPVGKRSGIGAHLGSGQPETGHLRAVRQARQPAFLLCLGTVFYQQLTRTE